MRAGSQPLAPRGLPSQQERAWELASSAQLECSEILVPVAIRHIGILRFPLRQIEQILLGDLPLFCVFTQMRPPFSWQPLPFGHASTSQDQRPKFIDHSILLIRIVIRKVLLQSAEEIPLAILLALQADANERGDCLAHTRIGRPRVPRHLIGETGRQPDGIPRFGLSRIILRLPAAAAALDCCLGVRHISSECLTPMHLGNSPLSCRRAL